MSDNEEELFEVENVVDSRIVRNVVQYRVRWSNFSPQHDTWEPEENLLTCHDLIEKYLAEKKNSNSNENNNSPAAAMDFENGDSNAASSSSATATEAKCIEETNSSIPSIIETESNLFSNLKANTDAFSTAVDEANTSKVSEQSEQELEQPEEEEDKTENDKITTSPRRRKRQQRKPRWEIIDVVQETFWKQLEKGQVDLSMGLYERVKRKRQAAEAASAKFVSPKRRVREKKAKPTVFNESDNEMTDKNSGVIHDLTNEQVDENEEGSKNDSNISPNSPSKSVKTYSRRSKVKNNKAELKIDELVKAIVQPNIPKSLGKSSDTQPNQNSIDSSMIENGTESNAKSAKNKTVISTANGQSTEEDVDKPVSCRATLYSSRQSDTDFQEKLNKVVEEVICRSVPNENTTILSTPKSETIDSKQVKEESDVFHKESNGAVHSVETATTDAIQRDSSEENVVDYLAETLVSVVNPLNSVEEEKIECKPKIYLKTDIPDSTDSSFKLEENLNSANSSSSVKPLEPSVPSRGRWLPLAPKLVTINHILPETSLAAVVDNSIELESLEDSQSPALDDLPPVVNTPPSEQQIIDNINDSESRQTESKIAPPKVVSKRQIDDLAADIEEDLNVNDFFKTDMHKCQEEERQTGRFVTNDMFAEACRLGNFEIVRSALTASKNYKCPYDVEAVDIYGNTLLMSATIHKCDPWHSSDDVIELLAQYGANLNASNRAGETALMLAIEHEHLCKVTKLLSLGAAVNLPNRCGETPLMVASRKGFAMVAHRLLEYGADFNATTTNGRTVTDMASTSKGVMKVLQMHESRVKLAFEQELLTVIEPDKIKLKHTLFPMHCYAINESRTFRIMFNYKPFPFPPKHFTILVVGIAKLGTHVVSVRFWGTSPVVNVLLNDIEQQAVQEDGRFIFTLSPLKSGANELLLKCADNYKMSQCKLLTSAFVVQMI